MIIVEAWESLFGSPVWLIVRWLYCALSATWFFYVWGWGDVSYFDDTTEDGDAAVHVGLPDDPWHRRRRYANRAIAIAVFLPVGEIWIDGGMMAGLVVVAVASRKAFRQGVWDGDPREFRRWFGASAKPWMVNGFRPL